MEPPFIGKEALQAYIKLSHAKQKVSLSFSFMNSKLILREELTRKSTSSDKESVTVLEMVYPLKSVSLRIE